MFCHHVLQRHTVEQLGELAPLVQILDAPVPQLVDQPMDVLTPGDRSAQDLVSIPSSSRGSHGAADCGAVGGCADDRVSRDVGSGVWNVEEVDALWLFSRVLLPPHPGEEEEKEEEEGKDEEGMLLLFMTSLTILSSVLWVVSTANCTWQSLVLFSCCLRTTKRGLFWEMTSGSAVFSASWFDSGYYFLSVYGALAVVMLCVKVDLGS